MHKGDQVFYKVRKQPYIGRIIRVHRDKTLTIQAQWNVDDDGQPVGCYHGDIKFRCPVDFVTPRFGA